MGIVTLQAGSCKDEYYRQDEDRSRNEGISVAHGLLFLKSVEAVFVPEIPKMFLGLKENDRTLWLTLGAFDADNA